MPLTIDEVIADGGAVAAFVSKVRASVEGLPKPPAVLKASDVTKVIADLAPELGALIDKVQEDIKD
jgi:hypothetical protein